LYGREKSLKQLILKFWGDNVAQHELKFIDQCTIQVVWGLGGCGKTTLASFYAKQFQKYYSGGVFLFNAQSAPSIHQSLKNHIARLTGKSSFAHTSLQEDYQVFLSLLVQRGNVLIIFDSCDKQGVINHLLPTSDTKCHVIITTRCNKSGTALDRRADNVIHLGMLEEEDAIQATLCWAGRSDSLSALDEEELSNAKKVVHASGIECLPLSLRHVGMMLKECELSYQQYLHMMSELKLTVKDMDEFLKYCGLPHLQDALSKDGITDVADMIHVDLTQLSTPISPLELNQLQSKQNQVKSGSVITWELDIREVTKQSPIARTVLDVASLLDCKRIDRDLLLKYTFHDCREDTVNRMELRRMELRRATSLLSQFCLLEETTSNTYRMHSLVQQSIMEGMVRDGTLSCNLCLLSKCLTNVLPQTANEIKQNLNNSRMLELTSNVYVVASHILTSEQQDQECWQLLQIACWMAIELQPLSDAEDLCEQKLELVKKSHQSEPERLLESLLDYGWVQMMLERPQLTQQSAQEALDLSTRLGIEVVPIMYTRALKTMASCHMLLKEFEDAERLFYQALSFAERSGVFKMDISHVYNNLAIMYDKLGKTDLAIKNYHETLGRIRLEPEVNHLELSRTRYNLAVCYYRSGQLEHARPLFEEALSGYRKRLPPLHPSLAKVLQGLALAYDKMGERDKAVKLQQECLMIMKQSLPEQHPYTRRAMVNLGSILCNMGDFRNALVHVKSGLAVLLKKDPNSSLTADGLYWLGECQRGLGQLSEAYKHVSQCLLLYQDIYPGGHEQIKKAEGLLQKIINEQKSAGSPSEGN
jgi:tetratricopeptide (TPR) repeat protein/gluconate kinase